MKVLLTLIFLKYFCEITYVPNLGLHKSALPIDNVCVSKTPPSTCALVVFIEASQSTLIW